MSARPETGTMTFGDDWPGVFIRGDNAAYYAMSLRRVLERGDAAVFERAVVEGLLRVLCGSNATEGEPESQRLRPFAECVAAEDAAGGGHAR